MLSLGSFIAFLGLFLADRLHAPVLDGVASLLIGVLLGLVAVLLAREAKDLLIGEGVSPDTVRSIRQLIQSELVVEHNGYPFTMYLGPNEGFARHEPAVSFGPQRD